MSAEIALFYYRLKSLSGAGIKRFMCHFHHLRKYCLNLIDILQPSVELADVCELLSVLDDDSVDWKSITAGYMSSTRERQRYENILFTDSFHIAVPFRFVERLVARRQVLLNDGIALLPPSHLPHILAAVFRKWLKYGLLLARICQPRVMSGDDRFKQLFKECQVNRFVCSYASLFALKHFPGKI